MRDLLTRADAASLPLVAGTVHCIIGSPPYFRQRKYKCPAHWPAVTFRPSPHLSAEWTVAEWYGELGWEPHPLDFVGHLVLVYRDAYRVLRDDGHCWIVISDKRTPDRQWHSVPEMLLSALVADGWRHEDTVIWHKESAMPGSQTNRFTRDFEKVFVLNKSTDAYFDIDAVREASIAPGSVHVHKDGQRYPTQIDIAPSHDIVSGSHRTRRTVWTVNPKGTNLEHYAAFPPDLVRPMLRCSLSERGCCVHCGKPWQRVVERIPMEINRSGRAELAGNRTMPSGTMTKPPESTTLAWVPACSCYGPPSRGPVRCGKCGGTGREKRRDGRTPDELLAMGHHNRYGKVSGSDTRGMPTREWLGVETGQKCPHCDGTGTVEGDVWPDDVDTWPVAPSVVLDNFAGTCATAEALASLQVGGEYPAVFVGADLNHHYLADLARQRLQLDALARWEGGAPMEGGFGWISEIPEGQLPLWE